MRPTRKELALSAMTCFIVAGLLGISGSGTRAYGAGLTQLPKSSAASARVAAGSKSPTSASSALLAP